jgi:hypothetical protein
MVAPFSGLDVADDEAFTDALQCLQRAGQLFARASMSLENGEIRLLASLGLTFIEIGRLLEEHLSVELANSRRALLWKGRRNRAE